MSRNSPNPIRISTSRRRTWATRVAFIALCLLAIGAAVFYLTASLGFVHGEEFSPDVFRRRSFTYYEIPLLGLQIWPIDHSYNTGDLAQYLVDKQIIDVVAVSEDDKRWDLVEARRGLDPAVPPVAFGDARILCYYLDSVNDEGDSVWQQWSEDHQDLAKVLWPAVARVARQQMYLMAPDLLGLAKSESDPDRLQIRIDEYLSQEYLLFGDCQRELDRHEEAVALYTEALSHSPQLVAAIRGRAESLTALGKDEDAAADRALLRELAHVPSQ